MAEFKIPGGKEKDVPLTQAKMESLTYWADRIGQALGNGGSRYPDRDKQLHAALRAEIARREGGGKPQQQNGGGEQKQQAAGSALATRPVDELVGSFTKADQVTMMLREAQKVAHLISPQTSCGALPEGCCIASSVVLVEENDTYEVGSELCLDKTALAKISAAAGIDWDPERSMRLDNGRNPHYVHYRSVCYVRNFDGTQRTLTGNVEVDLRDGIKDADDMKPGARDVARKFILRLAESKSKNRAIRDLGIRPSYGRRELDKPFVVVKIMFTGQSDDPGLRTLFATEIARSFTQSRGALFAGDRHPTPALPTPSIRQMQQQGHEPPPVGQSAEDDWSQYGDGDSQPAQSAQLPAGADTKTELAKPGESVGAVPVGGVGEQKEMKL